MRWESSAVSVVAVIGFIVGWVLVSGWRTRRTGALRRPRGGVLEDRVRGLSRIALPADWRPAAGLNEHTEMQALDPLRSRYLLVFSESREDFEPGATLEDVANWMRNDLAASKRMLALRGPEERQVGGFRAIQYEFDAAHDVMMLTFLQTVVEGRRGFHQVVGWAPRSMFDRQIFEALLETFSELPGPDPRPPVIDLASLAVPGKQGYEVH
jgi:hypothetical protein